MFKNPLIEQCGKNNIEGAWNEDKITCNIYDGCGKKNSRDQPRAWLSIFTETIPLRSIFIQDKKQVPV